MRLLARLLHAVAPESRRVWQALAFRPAMLRKFPQHQQPSIAYVLGMTPGAPLHPDVLTQWLKRFADQTLLPHPKLGKRLDHFFIRWRILGVPRADGTWQPWSPRSPAHRLIRDEITRRARTPAEVEQLMWSSCLLLSDILCSVAYLDLKRSLPESWIDGMIRTFPTSTTGWLLRWLPPKSIYRQELDPWILHPETAMPAYAVRTYIAICLKRKPATFHVHKDACITILGQATMRLARMEPEDRAEWAPDVHTWTHKQLDHFFSRIGSMFLFVDGVCIERRPPTPSLSPSFQGRLLRWLEFFRSL